MNKKRTWILGIALLAIGGIALGLTARQNSDQPPRLDIAGAAVTLGVSEEALIDALGLPEAPPNDGQRPEQGERPRPDLATAAETLGITEADLQAALGEPGAGHPDLATVASSLGITEDTLVEALGLPAGPPERGAGQPNHSRPELDLATAAQTLGVSEQALIDALGLPEDGPQGMPCPGDGGPHGNRR
jgi:hypothetical protein